MSKANNGITIITIPDGAIIYHKLTRTSWTISDNKALLEIIKDEHNYFIVERRNGRRFDARIDIHRNGARITRHYLQRIAYDCYYNGLTMEVLAQFYSARQIDSNNKDYPTIDHLDGDQFNNRIENLYEMPMMDNVKKRQKPKKFKGVRCITLANDNKRCKIQYAYTDYKGRVRVLRYICWDAYSIRDCLDYLYSCKFMIERNGIGTVLNDTSDYIIEYTKLPIKERASKIKPVNPHVLSVKVASLPDGLFAPITIQDYPNQ